MTRAYYCICSDCGTLGYDNKGYDRSFQPLCSKCLAEGKKPKARYPFVVVKDCGFGRVWSRHCATREEADTELAQWRQTSPGGDWRIQYVPHYMAAPELLVGSWGAPDNGWGGAML